MDILYYFKPVDFTQVREGKFLKNRHSLGYTIEKNTTSLTGENIQKVQLAIIGVPDETNSPNKGTKYAPGKIREHLYSLTCINPKLKIIDLGNLKKGAHKGDLNYAIRDVVDYLNEKKIITIILGGGQDIGYAVTKAFKYDKYFQMSTIDPAIDMKAGRETYNSNNYISRILKDSPDIFNINFIGYQSYFVPPNVLEKARQNDFTTLRLGEIREDITVVEPLIRDSKFVSFDIGSVRLQDAPGNINCSPNGIYGEEACQIARYAGISEKVSVFGIFEVNPKKDNQGQASMLAAQIIWYFIEGSSIRKTVNLYKSQDDFIEYNIGIEDTGTPLIFYKHKPTNRWWMKLEGLNGETVFVSCSGSDYKIAAAKEIPSKWLMYIRKIDRLSK